MDLSPLWISLEVSIIATVIAVITGLYAARWVYKTKHLKGLLDVLFTLPLVLPPTVVGFFILLFMGKNSWGGQFLEWLGFSFIFSPAAAVAASAIMAFPLMYRTVRGSFEQIDKNIIDAGRTLGIREGRIFWRIIVPNAKPGIIAGTILAFARALGEFGATIMVAGNIPGRTQTMAVAIYTAVQAGRRELAFLWVGIILIISLVSILMLNVFLRRSRRWV